MKASFLAPLLAISQAGTPLLSLADAGTTPVSIQSDTCAKKSIASPLAHTPEAFSQFNSNPDHYGVDFVAKDETVLAVAPGTVKTIDWNVKSLPKPNARSGLNVRDWGRYVVIHHDDGSESLYAHLDIFSAMCRQ